MQIVDQINDHFVDQIDDHFANQIHRSRNESDRRGLMALFTMSLQMARQDGDCGSQAGSSGQPLHRLSLLPRHQRVIYSSISGAHLGKKHQVSHMARKHYHGYPHSSWSSLLDLLELQTLALFRMELILFFGSDFFPLSDELENFHADEGMG